MLSLDESCSTLSAALVFSVPSTGFETLGGFHQWYKSLPGLLMAPRPPIYKRADQIGWVYSAVNDLWMQGIDAMMAEREN